MIYYTGCFVIELLGHLRVAFVLTTKDFESTARGYD